jgi:hypothetical protein
MKVLDMDIERDTIYGYPVKDLILFAMAAQKQGITPYDLANFRLDCELAYSIVKAQFDKEVKDNKDKLF